MLLEALKHLVVGRPLATAQAIHERLTKRIALAVFSSDALSSTAYATEEILLVLALAAHASQGASFWYVLPISGAIAVLLWLVALSYRQTIHAYPSGGGAYIVARQNLGVYAGLTAAAALLVDYVLTVAVSISAGVLAITSATQGTAFAWLEQYRVGLCLLAVAFIMLANLRGLRESGGLFAIPTYIFVVSFLAMIVYGLILHAFTGAVADPQAETLAYAEGHSLGHLTFFLILGAFANGCTALTGVEAISNGVPAFREPQSNNAAITLFWMATLLTLMFLGTSLLAYLYQVQPRVEETVISQFARTIFTGPMRWAYFVIQAATAAILLLAANTSYADFPRLLSLMARDRFAPRQFSSLGDRLVFSNGIIVLSLFAMLLLWIFRGDTSRLIPLYAVGVFLSFTLSQIGMVRHWLKLARAAGSGQAEAVAKAAGWRRAIAVNAVGAVATSLVLTIFVITKFLHGAWIVVVVIPVLVYIFRSIKRHYLDVNRRMSLDHDKPLPVAHIRVVVPVTRVHRGVYPALSYGLAMNADIHAVYVELDAAETERIVHDWQQLRTHVELRVLPSPYRSFVGTLLAYLQEEAAKHPDTVLTVLLPELVPAHWWQQALHNQSFLLLKGALLYRPNIIVTSVPCILH